MDQFHLTLPANIDNKQHDNTLTHYYTKLATPLELDETYEVALADISLTYSWKNLTQNQTVWLVDDGNEPKTIDTAKELKKCKYGAPYVIPAGHYGSVAHLSNVIQQEYLSRNLKEIKQGVTLTAGQRRINSWPVLEYDANNNRVYQKPGELRALAGGKAEKLHLKLSPDLRALLGMDPTSTEIISEGFGPDFNGNINSVFVYSNIVQHSIVGDQSAQLLRLVHLPANRRYGQNLNPSLDRLQYCSLQLHTFQEIEIELRDDTGQHLKFDNGRVIVTLHFRKKKTFFE